jgi:hypothetical protein
MFGVGLPFLILYPAVAVLFGIQALLPMPPVAGLAVKTVTAGTFLNFFGISLYVGSCTAMVLWIINIGIPMCIALGLVGKTLFQLRPAPIRRDQQEK